MLLLCTFTQSPNLVVMEAPSLARSQKLQEHVWERGGALAPAMSLRLEVTLFAACLRGKRSGRVFVTTVSPIYVDRSTAADHEVFQDTDRELQDLVRLEVKRASSFGSTSSSSWPRGGFLVAFVSTP